MYAHDFRPLREHLVELGLELLREVLQLGLQARLQPLSSPHNLLPERRQTCSKALLALNERSTEELSPFLGEVPAVPVGQVRAPRRAGHLAGRADLIQEIQHQQQRLSVRLALEAPDRINLDSKHRLLPTPQ